jgi:RNA polymerase sigma factor (sigma-70 family)
MHDQFGATIRPRGRTNARMFRETGAPRNKTAGPAGISSWRATLATARAILRVKRLQPPLTRPTLVGALREGLRWEEFVALYGRLILFWGRAHFGLQASDAENLCQEVLLRVWRGIGTFNPARGRFRAWLYVCTRNAASNLRRGRHGEQVGAAPGEAHSAGVARPAAPDAGGLDAAVARLEEDGFELEDLQTAVSEVRARMQPWTWKAFLLSEFFDLTGKEIGAWLGMQPVAVHQAVYRVRQSLKRRLARAVSAHPPAEESGR